MKHVPFNADNLDGPLDICLCKDCDAVLMLNDKQRRVRVAVPNVVNYVRSPRSPDYHAPWGETKPSPKPDGGRSVYDGLRPDFAWPQGT